MMYTLEHAFYTSKYHQKLPYIKSLHYKDVYTKETSLLTDIYFQMGVFNDFIACKLFIN